MRRLNNVKPCLGQQHIGYVYLHDPCNPKESRCLMVTSLCCRRTRNRQHYEPEDFEDYLDDMTADYGLGGRPGQAASEPMRRCTKIDSFESVLTYECCLTGKLAAIWITYQTWVAAVLVVMAAVAPLKGCGMDEE